MKNYIGDNKMDYRLSSSVVYRLCGNLIYMNDIKLHQIAFLNTSAYDLIQYLEEWRSEEDLFQYIKTSYFVTDTEAQLCLRNVIEALVSLGMIITENNYSSPIIPARNIPNYEEEEFLVYLMDNHILFSVTIELTYSCNLSCRHCYISKQNRTELSTENVLNLLDILKKLNVVNVVFTGGELFVRDDAIDIIQYACKLGFLVDIFSNGTLLDDGMINKMLQCGIHSFQCSIYSSVPYKHDEFVGKSNSFKKTMEVLNRFHNAGVLVGLKTCLMDCNATEYDELKHLAETVGAEFQFTYSIMPKKDGDMSTTKNRITEQKQIQDLVRKLVKDKRIDRKETIENEYLCSAGYSSLSIDPYGDIYLCNALGIKVGNILEDNIEDLWNHSDIISEWLAYSKDDMTECQRCKYRMGCEFCPGTALKETGSLFKCYSEAKTWAKEVSHILNI